MAGMVPLQLMVYNLGAVLDPHLFLESSVLSMPKSILFYLELCRYLRPFLSVLDLIIAVPIFVTSKLDYCNALYNSFEGSSEVTTDLESDCSPLMPLLEKLHWCSNCLQL